MSSDSATLPSDTASVFSGSSSTDLAKTIWLNTQWTAMSLQARRLGMPKAPYFDPKTMLLSKEVNKKLWRQMSRLYNFLGPDRAPYATPVMLEGGEIEWHSYLDGSKGETADIFDEMDG